MEPIEYDKICDGILTSTLQYINFETLQGHTIDKAGIPGDPVYVSAVADPGPVTLVYTPAGSGKSRLVSDRVAALRNSGVIPQEIVVLNMNIAKVRQMSAQMPGVNVMTFNDFVHGIFSANMPCVQQSDLESVIGTLWLQRPTDQQRANRIAELIRKLSVKDPQDQNVIMSLYVNRNLDFVVDVLKEIKKADSGLEAMVTQNLLYRFQRDPYEARAILVNGVQNMPLPILCSVLQYANAHKCSLFMTGSPKETIYEFSMAYGSAMDKLSAYDGKGLHIVRLSDTTSITQDIKNALDMNPAARIPSSSVSMSVFDIMDQKGAPQDAANSVPAAIGKAFGRTSSYLPAKLSARQPVLVLARSKKDIALIRATLESEYRPYYPGLRIEDLTRISAPPVVYGPTLAKHYTDLKKKYAGGIVMGTLFMELYDILAFEEQNTLDAYAKEKYAGAKAALLPWTQAHIPGFNGMDNRLPLVDAIQTVIDVESADVQAYLKRAREEDDGEMSRADIVLSTIHAAVDLRMDNVMVFMRSSGMADEGVYRVALSRARKTEHVVFASYKRHENQYQRYLKTHVV